MKKEELAAKLTGREYRRELTPAEEKEAKKNGLVVVYGASDDLVELRGAINEEVGVYDGGSVYLCSGGILANDCGDDDCPYFEKEKEKAKHIDALWCAEGDYSWTYNTSIPHATFEIVEDGEPYCRGLVFSLGDLG